MTEAIRHEGSRFQPATAAISGVVLENTIDLTGIKNVTEITPATSLSQRNPNRRTGFRATIAFGTAMAIGATGIASAQSPEPSFGPDTSPVPSVTPNPETGLLPCPTPTPEPGETPLPDRTLPPDIGHVGGEVLLAQKENSNGETVIVTLAQEAPASVAPASPAASEGPKTALVNCDLPALDINYEINKLINQKDKQIKAVKYGTIDKAILGDPKDLENKPGFWNKYEAELSGYTVTTGLKRPFTKEYLIEGLDNLKNGFEGVGDNEGAIMQTRQETAAAAVKLFILIADWTTNPNIRRDALRIADMMFDHGVRGINTTKSYDENLDFMKYLVEDMFIE